MARTGLSTALEELTVGPLFVADNDLARRNKAVLEAHFKAEWGTDIEATMRTMHPDRPWQRILGLGIDVQGFDEVRDYYLRRFETWPDPVMEHFDRVTVTDTVAYVEGTLKLTLQGDFQGLQAEGGTIESLTVIVIDFRDGLLLGETVHLDSAKAAGRVGGRADAS